MRLRYGVRDNIGRMKLGCRKPIKLYNQSIPWHLTTCSQRFFKEESCNIHITPSPTCRENNHKHSIATYGMTGTHVLNLRNVDLQANWLSSFSFFFLLQSAAWNNSRQTFNKTKFEYSYTRITSMFYFFQYYCRVLLTRFSEVGRVCQYLSIQKLQIDKNNTVRSSNGTPWCLPEVMVQTDNS